MNGRSDKRGGVCRIVEHRDDRVLWWNSNAVRVPIRVRRSPGADRAVLYAENG